MERLPMTEDETRAILAELRNIIEDALRIFEPKKQERLTNEHVDSSEFKALGGSQFFQRTQQKEEYKK
jgi:hypothetical protein